MTDISDLLREQVNLAIANRWFSNGLQKKNRCLLLVLLARICLDADSILDVSKFVHEGKLDAGTLKHSLQGIEVRLEKGNHYEITTPEQAHLVKFLFSHVSLKGFFSSKLMTAICPELFRAPVLSSSRLALPASTARLAIEAPAAAADQPDRLAIVAASSEASAPRIQMPDFMNGHIEVDNDLTGLLRSLLEESNKLLLLVSEARPDQAHQDEPNAYTKLAEMLYASAKKPLRLRLPGTREQRLGVLGCSVPISKVSIKLEEMIAFAALKDSTDTIWVSRGFPSRLSRALDKYLSTEVTDDFGTLYDQALSDAELEQQTRLNEELTRQSQLAEHAAKLAREAEAAFQKFQKEISNAFGRLTLNADHLASSPFASLCLAISIGLDSSASDLETVQKDVLAFLDKKIYSERTQKGPRFQAKALNLASYKKGIESGSISITEVEFWAIAKGFNISIVIFNADSPPVVFSAGPSSLPVFIYSYQDRYYGFKNKLYSYPFLPMSEFKTAQHDLQSCAVYLERVDRYQFCVDASLGGDAPNKGVVYVSRNSLSAFSLIPVSDLDDPNFLMQQNSIYFCIDDTAYISVRVLSDQGSVYRENISLHDLELGALEGETSASAVARIVDQYYPIGSMSLENVQKEIMPALLRFLSRRGVIGNIRYKLLDGDERPQQGMLTYDNLNLARRGECFDQLNNEDVASFNRLTGFVLQDALFRIKKINCMGKIHYRVVSEGKEIATGIINVDDLTPVVCTADFNMFDFKDGVTVGSSRGPILNVLVARTSLAPEFMFQLVTQAARFGYQLTYEPVEDSLENGGFKVTRSPAVAPAKVAVVEPSLVGAQASMGEPLEEWDRSRVEQFLNELITKLHHILVGPPVGQAVPLKDAGSRDIVSPAVGQVVSLKDPRSCAQKLLVDLLLLGRTEIWGRCLDSLSRDRSGKITMENIGIGLALGMVHDDVKTDPKAAMVGINQALLLIEKNPNRVEIVKQAILSIANPSGQLPQSRQVDRQGLPTEQGFLCLVTNALHCLVVLSDAFSFFGTAEYIHINAVQQEALNRLLSLLLELVILEEDPACRQTLFEVAQFYQALSCVSLTGDVYKGVYEDMLSNPTLRNKVGNSVVQAMLREMPSVSLALGLAFSEQDLQRIFAWRSQRMLMSAIDGAHTMHFVLLNPEDGGVQVAEKFFQCYNSILPEITAPATMSRTSRLALFDSKPVPPPEAGTRKVCQNMLDLQSVMQQDLVAKLEFAQQRQDGPSMRGLL